MTATKSVVSESERAHCEKVFSAISVETRQQRRAVKCSALLVGVAAQVWGVGPSIYNDVLFGLAGAVVCAYIAVMLLVSSVGFVVHSVCLRIIGWTDDQVSNEDISFIVDGLCCVLVPIAVSLMAAVALLVKLFLLVGG